MGRGQPLHWEAESEAGVGWGETSESWYHCAGAHTRGRSMRLQRIFVAADLNWQRAHAALAAAVLFEQ